MFNSNSKTQKEVYNKDQFVHVRLSDGQEAVILTNEAYLFNRNNQFNFSENLSIYFNSHWIDDKSKEDDSRVLIIKSDQDRVYPGKSRINLNHIVLVVDYYSKVIVEG
jgi:hypothetical protein